MHINLIGPNVIRNSVIFGASSFIKPSESNSETEYNRHEQNIIRTIGLERYQNVCKFPNPVETKNLSYLLKNLDDSSIIILGNPYTDDNEQALENHINRHPELMEKIEKAYIVPSDYDNAVFITKSNKEDNIGVEYFMVHSEGKLRIETPFWSSKQSGILKTTRYLRPGDVFKVEDDNHHIKLETRNAPKEKPSGISTIDFVDLL